MLRSLRWLTGPQEVPLSSSTTEVRALQFLLGLFFNQSTLAGMLYALNIPLVSTVSCIWNLQNTIHRFPEERVCKGGMDRMRRWRIQETVHSYPHVMFSCSLPSLSTISWKPQKKRMGIQRSELWWTVSQTWLCFLFCDSKTIATCLIYYTAIVWE